jgi:hypothetical protein
VRWLFCVALACAGVASTAVSATAQQPDRSRIELSGGIRWMGPIDFDAVDADETTSGGGRRTLFASNTSLTGSVGGTGIVGVRLSRLLKAEFAAAYNPTALSTRISSDVEGVPDVTVDARVTQFLLEGGIVAQPRRWQTRHLAPFVTAGFGYLRHLNEGRTLVETGRAGYVGGGLYYVRNSARPGRIKATGARVDVRAVLLRNGVSPDDTQRSAPAITAALFARF